MANSLRDLVRRPVGKEGHAQRVGIAADTKIFGGTMVSQASSGGLVATTTAGAGPCIGVSEHGNDNTDGLLGAKECMVEMERTFIFGNAGTNSFSRVSLIGSAAFAVDDHTVATVGTVFAGVFMGFDEEGVRVYVGPTVAAGVTLPVVPEGD